MLNDHAYLDVCGNIFVGLIDMIREKSRSDVAWYLYSEIIWYIIRIYVLSKLFFSKLPLFPCKTRATIG